MGHFFSLRPKLQAPFPVPVGTAKSPAENGTPPALYRLAHAAPARPLPRPRWCKGVAGTPGTLPSPLSAPAPTSRQWLHLPVLLAGSPAGLARPTEAVPPPFLLSLLLGSARLGGGRGGGGRQQELVRLSVQQRRRHQQFARHRLGRGSRGWGGDGRAGGKRETAPSRGRGGGSRQSGEAPRRGAAIALRRRCRRRLQLSAVPAAASFSVQSPRRLLLLSPDLLGGQRCRRVPGRGMQLAKRFFLRHDGGGGGAVHWAWRFRHFALLLYLLSSARDAGQGRALRWGRGRGRTARPPARPSIGRVTLRDPSKNQSKVRVSSRSG